MPNICFQCRDNSIEFVLRGTAITLIAFSDKPEMSKSDPGEIDWFGRDNDAVHSGGVRQNRFDIAKIDADRHGAGSLQCALFSEFDEALSIKFWKTKMPKSFIQEDEAGSLGTTDVFPDLSQVLTVKCDEIAEELDVTRLARRCRFLTIDPSLDIDAPFLCVLSAEKSLVDIFPLSSDLDSPGA